jgi:hypothetical protein
MASKERIIATHSNGTSDKPQPSLPSANSPEPADTNSNILPMTEPDRFRISVVIAVQNIKSIDFETHSQDGITILNPADILAAKGWLNTDLCYKVVIPTTIGFWQDSQAVHTVQAWTMWQKKTGYLGSIIFIIPKKIPIQDMVNVLSPWHQLSDQELEIF